MKTIMVRFSERLLDLVKDCFADISTPEPLSKQQAKAALASCLPALYDIQNSIQEPSSVSKESCTVEAAYLEKLIKVSFVASCILSTVTSIA